MELKEIINRKSPQHLTEDEMKYVVKKYIKELKGVDVEIDLTKGCMLGNRIIVPMYENQFHKLNKAFNDACKYYMNNG